MKLLIVDDEELLRQKLVRTISESHLAFETILTAHDAFQAIKVIEQHKPEIIVTDIRMPQKSGLEIARYIHENHPELTVILVTGYSDFDYAQAGIRYQVFDYILKPIDSERTISCIESAQKQHQEKQKKQDLHQVLQKYFSEHLETAKKQFLETLLFHSFDYNEHGLEQQKQQFHINFRKYRLISIRFILSQKDQPLQEEYYYAYVIQKKLRELHVDPLTYFFGNIIYLLHPADELDEEQGAMISLLVQLKQSAEQIYPFEMHIGISQISDTLLNIKALKKQTALCLEHLSNHSDAGYIFYDDISGEQTISVDISDLLGQLGTYVKTANFEKVRNCLEHIFRSISGMPENYCKSITGLIFSTITFTLHELQVDSNQIHQLESRISLEKYQEKQTVPAMLEWCMQVCRTVQEHFKAHNNHIIRGIYNYINQNYNKQIGLTDAAEYVGRNPSYISRLFKQSTDKTFTQILTDKRMSEAKNLLEQTSLKISQVAQQVGYPNLRYFNRIFSSHVGMTAGDYRKVVTEFSGK